MLAHTFCSFFVSTAAHVERKMRGLCAHTTPAQRDDFNPAFRGALTMSRTMATMPPAAPASAWKAESLMVVVV